MDGVVRALGDENSSVRAKAAAFLGEIGNEETVKPLILQLNQDSSSEVQEAAMNALVKLGKYSFDPLIKLLEEARSPYSPGGREYAAKALGKIGDKRAIGTLMESLAVRDKIFVFAVKEALKMLGVKAIPKIVNVPEEKHILDSAREERRQKYQPETWRPSCPGCQSKKVREDQEVKDVWTCRDCGAKWGYSTVGARRIKIDGGIYGSRWGDETDDY